MSVPPMPMASTWPSSSATSARSAARSPPTPRRTILTRRPSSSTCSSASRLAAPKETLTTVLSGRPRTRRRVTAEAAGVASGLHLGVPVEVGLGVDGEADAQALPEPPGARVVAVDAGQHPPRPPGEPALEVASAGGADAAALQGRQHEQQVHGGVAALGVVELVVEVAHHEPARERVHDRGLRRRGGTVLYEHQLGVAA